MRAALLPKQKNGCYKSGFRAKNESKTNPSRAEGYIVEVLERKTKELMVRVGSLCEKNTRSRRSNHVPERSGQQEKAGALARFILASPCDLRFPFSLRLDTEQIDSGILTQISPNCLLLVRPQEQIASDLWTAEVISAHGREDDVNVQENLVKINHHSPTEFSAAALQEAELLPVALRQEDYAHRQDLRHMPFVTIDGESAKDFDDAIYVLTHEKNNKISFVLYVAIADVSHYVPMHSALDKEAKLRGNSWYFPRSVEPMFPEKLSNGLCSLNPHEDKLSMVVEMHFDATANLQKSLFYPAVICSKARLTYTQVKQVLLEKDVNACAALEAQNEGTNILNMLSAAETLARILAEKRVQRGCLDFNRPEPEYFFDATGRIKDIGHKDQHFGHQLIEEFMIAANEAVAEFLEKNDMQFLYRVHPEPESERLQSLFTTLATTSLAQSIPKHAKAKDLQSILQTATGSEQEYIVSRLALRTMPQARYQPENTGHFGLASESYCHFTSPIRRYADMVVHRALKACLAMQKGKHGLHTDLLDTGTIPTGYKLLALADSLNLCERAAMEAEREMARRLAVLMLLGCEGQEFEGIIGSVTDFGIFVELVQMPVEGMIRIAELGDDFFEYDPERQKLIGIMSGASYSLGQNVRVRLKEANLGRLEISFSLLKAYGNKNHQLPRKQVAKLKGGRKKSFKNKHKQRF